MPDSHLTWLAQQSGLSMGQWLTVPMLLLGLYLIVTSRRRDPIMAPRETGGSKSGSAGGGVDGDVASEPL
jgi:hypothetical protein